MIAKGKHTERKHVQMYEPNRINRNVLKENAQVDEIDRRQTCDKDVCRGRITENYANTDRKDNVPGFWFALSSPRKSAEKMKKFISRAKFACAE